MKHSFFNMVLLQAICLFACGNNRAASDNIIADASSTEKTASANSNESVAGDDITGTWKLYLDAYDRNEN